jgi:hypothetical protein
MPRFNDQQHCRSARSVAAGELMVGVAARKFGDLREPSPESET